MANATRRISSIRLARYAIVLGAVAVAAVLLLGPTWVQPIHEPTGLAFHQLKDHPQYHEEYIANHAERIIVLADGCIAADRASERATLQGGGQ